MKQITHWIFIAIILIASGFVLVPLHVAQAAKASANQPQAKTDTEGGIVREISFVGTRSADLVTLKKTLASKEGEPYRAENVRDDISRLYRLGLFRDIKVQKLSVENGVKLVYKVDEKPELSSVRFEGNKKIKTKKLEEASKVRMGVPFNEEQVMQTVEAIRALYTEKGYSLADISYELVPDPQTPNRYALVFTIQENGEVKIERVTLIGNRVFSDKELKKIIKTKEKGILSFLNKSGKYVKEMIDQDVYVLTRHYNERGYLKAKVSAPQVTLNQDRSALYVTFAIAEGEQYRIGDIGVSGDILTTQAELLKLLKIESKAIANRQVIEDDVTRLVTLYGDRGYAFVNVVPRISPNDETKTASVVYDIDKGQKIRVERIVIKGNTTTRDKVIRRELLVKENDLFNRSDLDLSIRKLYQLGFFENIDVSTPRGSTDDQVVITLDVKEKQTGSFNVGAGFSTAESFIATASVQKDNFMGRGVGGAVSIELSGKRQQFSFSYSDPYFLDSQWMLSTSGFRRLIQYEDFNRNSFGGTLSLGRRFFNFWSIALGYKIENVDLENVSRSVPERFDSHLSGLTSAGSFTVMRDTRDNRLMPTKGMLFAHTVEYAGNGLGGSNDYIKNEFNARVYVPVVWKTVFKANVGGGYVNSLNGDPVPLYERYFLGGVNSLRGFDPRAVGPKVRSLSSIAGGDSTFVYGGNKMVLANIEYEVPVYDPAGLRAVVFADAGNAFAEDEDFDLTSLRYNVGAGLRWVSPFGPLRFEWGVPINRKPGEDPLVFNFMIGTFF